jgi:tellurite resistance protein
MKSMRLMLLAALVLTMALAVAGCSGPVDQVVKSDELRGQMMEKITGDPAMAANVVERMLGSEETQSMVIDKVMQNTDAAQALMMRLAKDRTMVDGIINVAVQDPATKDHLMTLFRGMEMAAK